MSRPAEILSSLWEKFNIKNKESLTKMLEFIKQHDGEGITKHNFSDNDYNLAEHHFEKIYN